MIVIDASIALKWILTEEANQEAAQKILQNHVKGKDEIVIPSLLLMEYANILVTKSRLTEAKIKEGLELINEANLRIYSFSKRDLLETSIMARKHKTTFYDMLYAVVAKRNKAILVTADENFIKKTGFKFVRHIKNL